jgi:hypothetical protein
MTRINTALLFLFLFAMSGCAFIAAKTPAPTGDMQGRIVDNVYVSPNETFRLSIPPLSKAAPRISDEVPSPGTLVLTLSDELCREFIVSERPGILGDRTIEAWVHQNIIQPLETSGIKLQKPKTLKTRLGSVVMLRYQVAGAAPCVQTTVKDGKKVESKLDADVGWYVFYHSGKFYRLIYVLGVGPDVKGSWFIRRAPVDTVLEQFAEGLELAGMKK